MILTLLLATPIVTGVLAWLSRRLRWVEMISVIGATLTLVLAATFVVRVSQNGPQQELGGLLYVDALSALMISTVALVGFAATLVSIGYLRRDLDARHVPNGRSGVRWYYLGINAFVASMLATVSFNNLGLLWVGIEATTLASALLVGFYRTGEALEAAWKYLIICTVGITFALFGVILTYYAAVQSATISVASLDWTVLSVQAGELDPAMMRLAFVFVLVGFGTKAGFAPLHTWLADAHSQAPSPVSALLSGVLLSCALYGILRFHVITLAATETPFSSYLLLGFGVLSVAVAVPFIMVQRDLKRLLAYSSVEHIGLMAVAFGMGGRLGFYAGILHMINHAVTKAVLFFIAGDLAQRFGTRRISAMRGVIRAAPLLGWMLLLGILAIAGLPPAGIFISEIAIVSTGFTGGNLEIAAAAIVVLLLGLVFAGMLAHALRISYGTPSDLMAKATERLERLPVRARAASLVALVPLVIIVILFGIYVPEQISDLIQQAAILDPASEGVATR